ncbi:helix-turn-helix domain-containing protein [Hymenobacter lucidus]|uniref:Helix-turn-helix domain-containing protein n=1 Tax=Hymenobacter lucidus TaxID=2880930 RepID=A0ABS8AWD5_9BACT|nr:helix-turn-helix transcriptional regulator [Hymenobacter lucidus]MCB2410111.1 helix-turn-helix domain-containing protein [Hymenobacter lucidus]
MFSAARINAIRKSKGLSQEVLAERSGVSLRTIQRVEQGETVPRGHTLHALAAALEVPLEQFRAEPTPEAPPEPQPELAAPEAPPAPLQPEQPEPAPQPAAQLFIQPASQLVAQPAPEHQPLVLLPQAATPMLRHDPELVQLLNLSALSLLVLPLLNIVVPLWLWRKYRHTTAHVAEVGRRVLGFQVLWQVGSFFAYLLLMLAHILAKSYQWPMWRGGYLEIFIVSYTLNVLTVGCSAVQLRRGNLDIYPVRL